MQPTMRARQNSYMPNSLLGQMVGRIPLASGSGTYTWPAGAHSWVRKTLGIDMEGEQTGNLSNLVLCFAVSDLLDQSTSGVSST